ncbi:SDR family oxidoreductase [Pseudoglutamicibacter albus]|uniref:SDR family NAD(P)-dependent oxidoreductase n=1 Tax=Pseudoglutamicibacter albus TaxID=98671 RepID=UPI001EF42186|nr:SDR family NAD(P)-dependent oxidoreductase [Pseudoglutamicibacter albus]MCG7303833.1 SDR family oxidoreductase [Pseudoglutamicibacter albus]
MSQVFSTDAFAGNTVLITGATGGIGAECAHLYSASGADLVLVDLRPEPLEQLASELSEPGSVTTVAADLTDAESRAQVVSAIKERGGVHHMVLAAGIYPEHPVAGMPDEEWRRTLSINLDAVFALTRDLEPEIHDGGSIVNFGSMAGARGSKNHAHYAATKGALVSFSRSLAWELGPRGIRVNAVAPGIIATSMTKSFIAEKGEATLNSTPMGRFGEPEEVASVVLFLTSDAASFVTGDVIHINGGLHMAG